MVRVVFEAVAVFFAPFLAYSVYLFLRQQFPTPAAWSRARIALLSLAGLVSAAALILGLGLLADQSKGAYVPAHIENGQLVPGAFK